MEANTVVSLNNGSLVNFLYSVGGLGKFSTEYKKSVWLKWNGMTVPVLPLSSIIKSKEKVAREKDMAHLPLLRQVLKATTKIRP